MEIDTGLFEGEYEKYSHLVEFIDIPGLNEKGLENNFYFKNILPFIKMNFLFPIIIIDADKYQSTDVFRIFSKTFEPYISEYLKEKKYNDKIAYDIDNQRDIFEKIKNKSFFLINKLNKYEKSIRNKISYEIIAKTTSEFNVNLTLGSNCLVINAKAKNLEINKMESFLKYTE